MTKIFELAPPVDKTAYLKTYGCQMNEQDSLQMRGLLGKMGYGFVNDPVSADLILYSTCSIREKAVNKVYSDLGRIRNYAEQSACIVALAGCVAQQEKSRLFQRFPFLDLVFGPDAIARLPQMIAELEQKKDDKPSRLLATEFIKRQDFAFINLIDPGAENRFKAFVTIQKGCDNVCAFCIVPQVRGAEATRPSQDILQEVQALVEMGVKDVTLLGQNVNSYGWKTPGELSFAQLLQLIATKTKIERLRFTTSHPKDVGPDLIACFGVLPNLCHHFHLPVQSGSSTILEMMRRQYTREEYLKIIAELKRVRPDLALTTDFIVGFPGETETDFRATLTLLEELQFDTSYAFIYSPRPRTTAIKLKDDVARDVKARRLQELMILQQEISLKKNQALEGKICAILVEDHDVETGQWKGRTSSNKIVHFTSAHTDHSWLGQTVPVEIIQANPNSLLGELYADGR